TPDLLRRGTDAAVPANSIHDPPAAVESDHLVESSIDGCRERLRAENLLHATRLRTVDEHRGLALFGYLLCHSKISSRSLSGSVQCPTTEPAGDIHMLMYAHA